MTVHYYLGCDISLRSGGYAIIKDDNGVLSIEKTLVIKTTNKTTNGQSLKKIADEFASFIEGYTFAAVVKEKGFTRFNTATQQIFEATGVIEYLLSDYEIISISPTTIKKVIGGHGKAEKETVLDEVCTLLQIDRSVFVTKAKTARGKDKLEDDLSDAVAVVLTYVKQQRGR